MMSFGYRLFVAVFVVLVVSTDVKADPSMTDTSVPKTCPPGCFCLRDGKVVMNILDAQEKNIMNYQAECQTPAQIRFYTDRSNEYFCGTDVRVLGSYKRENSFIYVEDFSESYVGSFGFYGFKDGDFVYYQKCGTAKGNELKPGESRTPRDPYDLIFQCPKSYPNSDAGSKSLYDCFKYGENGNKVHYGESKLKVVDYNGWVPIINCQQGYYMPANTTECKLCSDNRVACPGGMFYVDKTYTTDRGTIACENGVEPNRASCKTEKSTISNPKGTNSSGGTSSSSSSNKLKTPSEPAEPSKQTIPAIPTEPKSKFDLGSVFTNALNNGKSAVVPAVSRSSVNQITLRRVAPESNEKQSVSRSANVQSQSPRGESVKNRDVKNVSRQIGGNSNR